jgi:glutamine cyclotransferase
MENMFFEGTDCLNSALQSGMASLKVMIASARSFGWGSNETVKLLYLVTWPNTLTYRVKTQDSKRYDSHL